MTVGGHVAKSVDPLASLAKQLGGSKRNALLKWCQNRTATYTVCVVFTIASVVTVATYVCCCFIMVILLQYRSHSCSQKPIWTPHHRVVFVAVLSALPRPTWSDNADSSALRIMFLIQMTWHAVL